jgi:deoxyribodipyrimidine photo-lyase
MQVSSKDNLLIIFCFCIHFLSKKREEIFVRKELAENFCHFNKNYDKFDGFRDWAKTTLNEHEKDKREYIYTDEEFEKGIKNFLFLVFIFIFIFEATTHDLLWNAAQHQLVITGKMNSFMRMYWAKKILEWTTDAKKALSLTNHLNDK